MVNLRKLISISAKAPRYTDAQRALIKRLCPIVITQEAFTVVDAPNIEGWDKLPDEAIPATIHTWITLLQEQQLKHYHEALTLFSKEYGLMKPPSLSASTTVDLLLSCQTKYESSPLSPALFSTLYDCHRRAKSAFDQASQIQSALNTYFTDPTKIILFKKALIVFNTLSAPEKNEFIGLFFDGRALERLASSGYQCGTELCPFAEKAFLGLLNRAKTGVPDDAKQAFFRAVQEARTTLLDTLISQSATASGITEVGTYTRALRGACISYDTLHEVKAFGLESAAIDIAQYQNAGNQVQLDALCVGILGQFQKQFPAALRACTLAFLNRCITEANTLDVKNPLLSPEEGCRLCELLSVHCGCPMDEDKGMLELITDREGQPDILANYLSHIGLLVDPTNTSLPELVQLGLVSRDTLEAHLMDVISVFPKGTLFLTTILTPLKGESFSLRALILSTLSADPAIKAKQKELFPDYFIETTPLLSPIRNFLFQDAALPENITERDVAAYLSDPKIDLDIRHLPFFSPLARPFIMYELFCRKIELPSEMVHTLCQMKPRSFTNFHTIFKGILSSGSRGKGTQLDELFKHFESISKDATEPEKNDFRAFYLDHSNPRMRSHRKFQEVLVQYEHVVVPFVLFHEGTLIESSKSLILRLDLTKAWVKEMLSSGKPEANQTLCFLVDYTPNGFAQDPQKYYNSISVLIKELPNSPLKNKLIVQLHIHAVNNGLSANSMHYFFPKIPDEDVLQNVSDSIALFIEECAQNDLILFIRTWNVGCLPLPVDQPLSTVIARGLNRRIHPLLETQNSQDALALLTVLTNNFIPLFSRDDLPGLFQVVSRLSSSVDWSSTATFKPNPNSLLAFFNFLSDSQPPQDLAPAIHLLAHSSTDRRQDSRELYTHLRNFSETDPTGQALWDLALCLSRNPRMETQDTFLKCLDRLHVRPIDTLTEHKTLKEFLEIVNAGIRLIPNFSPKNMEELIVLGQKMTGLPQEDIISNIESRICTTQPQNISHACILHLLINYPNHSVTLERLERISQVPQDLQDKFVDCLNAYVRYVRSVPVNPSSLLYRIINAPSVQSLRLDVYRSFLNSFVSVSGDRLKEIFCLFTPLSEKFRCLGPKDQKEFYEFLHTVIPIQVLEGIPDSRFFLANGILILGRSDPGSAPKIFSDLLDKLNPILCTLLMNTVLKLADNTNQQEPKLAQQLFEVYLMRLQVEKISIFSTDCLKMLKPQNMPGLLQNNIFKKLVDLISRDHLGSHLMTTEDKLKHLSLLITVFTAETEGTHAGTLTIEQCDGLLDTVRALIPQRQAYVPALIVISRDIFAKLLDSVDKLPTESRTDFALKFQALKKDYTPLFKAMSTLKRGR